MSDDVFLPRTKQRGFRLPSLQRADELEPNRDALAGMTIGDLLLAGLGQGFVGASEMGYKAFRPVAPGAANAALRIIAERNPSDFDASLAQELRGRIADLWKFGGR